MDALAELVRISTDLEFFFKELGATGSGLTNLANSIRGRIPNECFRHVRFIARIRNSALHSNPDIASQHIDAVRNAANSIFALCNCPFRYEVPSNGSGGNDFISQYEDLETLPTNPPSPASPPTQVSPPSLPLSPSRPSPTAPQPDWFTNTFDFLSDWFEKGCSFICIILFILFLLICLLFW